MIPDRTDGRPPGAADTERIEALITDHRAVAVRLARRFSVGRRLDADMLQVAMIGLLLAARRYDESIGPFGPFATATVSGELKKHLRSTGWAVHVSRGLQEDVLRVERAAERLEHVHGRSPTPAEIATDTGLTVEDVLAADRARAVRFSTELPATERVGAEEFDHARRVVLRDALDGLGEAHQRLLSLRFVDELTQREIAALLGISQPQVHRRIQAALARLEEILTEVGFEP